MPQDYPKSGENASNHTSIQGLSNGLPSCKLSAILKMVRMSESIISKHFKNFFCDYIMEYYEIPQPDIKVKFIDPSRSQEVKTQSASISQFILLGM